MTDVAIKPTKRAVPKRKAVVPATADGTATSTIDPRLVARFATRLDMLVPPGQRLGLAVSGGPDSLALLLLAQAARPGAVEAATVDHGLRTDSFGEAAMVGRICAELGVPHSVLAADWAKLPAANVQAKARAMRYRLLDRWAKERELIAIATAHHADDQAETVLMRLARGAGLGGLGGIRPRLPLPQGTMLVRPLLGWRKAALEAIVDRAGLTPADDPSNRDPAFDRTRMRALIGGDEAFIPARLARSAAALRDAEAALQWMAAGMAGERIVAASGELHIDPVGLPRDLQRRLLLIAFRQLGAPEPRGPELMRAMAALNRGGSATLSGLAMHGGETWRLMKEGPRR